MSDMNMLGNVLADMSDNLNKLRASFIDSIERLSAEREALIKVVNAHYDSMGQIIMDHIREVEKVQGVNHIPMEPDDAHPRYGDRA